MLDLSTATGSSSWVGTTLMPLLYDVVSLTVTVFLLEDLLDHRDRGLGEVLGVLEDRGVLLVGEDRLDRLELGVLAGDDREGLAAAAVAGALEGGDDAAGEAVVGREHAVDVLVGVGLGEQVLHALLGDGGVPAQGGDGLEVGLTGLDLDGAVVDLRLAARPWRR